MNDTEPKVTDEFARTSDGQIIGCATVIGSEFGDIAIVAPDRASLIRVLREKFHLRYDADRFHDVLISKDNRDSA